MQVKKPGYLQKLLNFIITSDRFYSIPVALALVSASLITVTFLALSSKLPPRLPLFYSLPWGEAQLVQKEQILILPAIIVAITLLNTFLNYQLHNSQTVLKRMIMLTLVLISSIITITAFKIIDIFL